MYLLSSKNKHVKHRDRLCPSFHYKGWWNGRSPVVSRPEWLSETAPPHCDRLWRFPQSIPHLSLHTTAGPACQTPASKDTDHTHMTRQDRARDEKYNGTKVGLLCSLRLVKGMSPSDGFNCCQCNRNFTMAISDTFWKQSIVYNKHTILTYAYLYNPCWIRDLLSVSATAASICGQVKKQEVLTIIWSVVVPVPSNGWKLFEKQ